MKKFCHLFLLNISLLLLTAPVIAQVILKKIFSGKKDSTRSASFFHSPAIAYAQETGLEFGGISLYSFYPDRKDIFTRNSSISQVVTFTTKKQANIKLQADIWMPQNRFHYTAEIRYKNFPFNFYGVGDNTLKADENRVTQRLFKLAGEAERRASHGFFEGVSASYEHHRFRDEESGGIFSDSSVRDRDGGRILYITPTVGFDSRNTNTYTTRGFYGKVSNSYAPDLFGGDNFTGSLLKVDFRHFRSFSEKTVLGVQLMYQSLWGSDLPFYLLPQLGNDQMMRGYYTGRYRDKNLLAAQAELRYRFIPRLGAVAFLGAGSVYGAGEFGLQDFKPSRGAGIRYFFDVDHGLSIRLDYGLGEKRANEKRQKGFYISLAEAF